MGHAEAVDPLTGLVGRAGLAGRFTERAEVNPHALVLHFHCPDIANLAIRYGDTVADQAVAEMARRLRSSLRESDLACRPAPDDFMAVCFAPWADEDAASAAMRLASALSRPMALAIPGGEMTSVTVSLAIGTALGPTGDFETLMQDASDSLDAAKLRRQARDLDS